MLAFIIALLIVVIIGSIVYGIYKIIVGISKFGFVQSLSTKKNRCDPSHQQRGKSRRFYENTYDDEDFEDMENEFEGDAEAIEYGRLRFARRCAYCHGGGGMGAKGPSLTKGKFKWSRKGYTSDLVNIIMGGIPNTQMGSFARTLDGDEVLKIIAYMRQETERVRLEKLEAEAAK